MSNIEPKCSYPECGPTCRKDCEAPINPVEPTCVGCGRRAWVVDPRNDAMRCVDYPKCSFPKPTTIEPTEEQKQAARKLYNVDIVPPEPIARLLAEREAKLREEVAILTGFAITNERDILRARVAELESRVSENIRLRVAAEERGRFLQRLANEARTRMDESEKRVAELEAGRVAEEAIDSLWARVMKKREAQHLADIKAAASRMYCREFEVMCSNNCPPKCHCVDCRIYERLAHYDEGATQ